MQTKKLQIPVVLTTTATVAGPLESEGELGTGFDVRMPSALWDEKCWEKAESKMQQQAINTLLEKSGKQPDEIDLLFAGDLLNQCTGTNFGIRDFGIPFYGQYGACSTMAQTLSLGAMAISGGFANNVICGTSSHYYSAERQFRLPIEYGGQRAPVAQWTVTGSGMALLTKCADHTVNENVNVKITHITTGKIIDKGITDVSNMGAAMAPAAVDTLVAHFNDTNTTPNDYDMIVTGDLGSFGRDIVVDLMERNRFDMGGSYSDCGTMIFDMDKKDYHCGGSGCGCSAVVLCSHLVNMLAEGTIKKLLFVGTGALMSPTSTLQGESIPSIAHAVVLEH